MDTRQPTLTDVARHAGVSYATADRVVNARGNVAAKSVARVEAAIKALGYARDVAAANLSKGRVYRFVFLLPEGRNSFFKGVRQRLHALVPDLRRERVELQVEQVAAFDAQALATRLRHLQHVDGVAFVGSNHPDVVRAVQALREGGAAVLSLVSDAAAVARHAYVGIDNYVAGQTAGRLIALAHHQRDGVVLPILGALTATDHAQRLEGLGAVLAQAAPNLTLCPEIEGRDDSARVEAMLRTALERRPSVTAIYSLGAGNSGLFAVLRELPRRPVVVVHEVTDHSRAALRDGLIDLIIDQRPEEEIAQALALLRRLADGQCIEETGPLVPAIYVKDNLPPEAALSGGSQP